jgi:hypothetical protein
LLLPAHQPIVPTVFFHNKNDLDLDLGRYLGCGCGRCTTITMLIVVAKVITVGVVHEGVRGGGHRSNLLEVAGGRSTRGIHRWWEVEEVVARVSNLRRCSPDGGR